MSVAKVRGGQLELSSFSGVVGQQRMKLALLLAAVEPRIGGVLIRGERGTAKSTLVRALAAILPSQEQVEDCPYQCSPNGPDQCPDCVARLVGGEELPVVVRPTRVVELPLGASEDRIVGSIDLELALQQGRRAFQPGLLAEANRQVLYVDEVNLLEHHLVDVLLDAAASGVNVVEREEISISHPSRFVLVGTMNPEEGHLRPQLLDRFGLCVEVAGLRSLADRVEVMQRDGAGVPPPGEDRQLAGRLRRAQSLLSRLETPELVLRMAASMSVDQEVIGHRSDLVLVRAAQARRALEAAQVAEPAPEELVVGLPDLADVAELALVHRRRSLGGSLTEAPAGISEAPAELSAPPTQAGVPDPNFKSGPTREATSDAGEAEGDGSPQGEAEASGDLGGSTESRPGPATTQPVEVEEGFEVGRIQLPRERLRRRGSGRRSQTNSRDRRGRYVSAQEVEHPTDLALDATLRAAAPHQVQRRARAEEDGGRRLQLEPQDLRQKVRQRRIGNLIVFAVDASASMDAEQRMDATRSAIFALLKDAYVRRDRVALISFSGRTAQVVLRPTASVDLAERHLTRIAVGGTTPLTHGLTTALNLIETERRRDPDVLPLLVLISDGRGNISFGGEEPLLEAQRMADQIRRDGVRALVIDSSRDHLPQPVPHRVSGSGAPRFAGYNFNACVDLAERMGATYFGLFDLSEGAILRPVAEALRQPASAGRASSL
ncbi:MAG TPA: VWA domain-containing protein [Candidatus Dormibacteraeota bacterium]|nr:VWA domain-containing protein [Candidatus Dormibacteraeota bacterium]